MGLQHRIQARNKIVRREKKAPIAIPAISPWLSFLLVGAAELTGEVDGQDEGIALVEEGTRVSI